MMWKERCLKGANILKFCVGVPIGDSVDGRTDVLLQWVGIVHQILGIG